MKRTLLIVIALTIKSLGVFAQNVNIPDANFKAYLIGNTAINLNADTEIQVSEANAFTGTIYCSVLNISDLTGIEEFTSIKGLHCNQNNLTSLNVSQNTQLTELYCLYNMLSTLDVSNNTLLQTLWCHTNNLTSLDLSNNMALKDLICYNNKLVSLNLGDNTLITNINCRNNNLTNLDVSQCVNLISLGCRQNNLTSLNVSQNTALTSIECNNNSINTLDVSNSPGLTYFQCKNNNLTALNMKNLNPSTLTNFNATFNPNLNCIEVDNVTTANSSWTNIDAGASFSLNCNPLVVNNIDLSKNISIYPNPVNSKLFLNTEEIITSIKIIDALGNTIKFELPSNTKIDVSYLSKGIYFLEIYTNKGLVSKKFIKD